MTHAAIHHSHASPGGFAGASSSGLNHRPAASRDSEVLEQAQKWVAQTFFGTLLKQSHEGPFHSDLMDGGRGGQAFTSLYDQRLADHMARGPGRKLAESIARKFEARKAYRNAAAPRAKFDAKLRSHTPTGGHHPHAGSGHVTPDLRA